MSQGIARSRLLALALAPVLALGPVACGPPEGERRPLVKTYETGQERAVGQEVYHDGDWVMEGAFVFYRPNGDREAEGAYEAGLETGPWTRWLEDGTRTEGTFVAGKREGKWTFWHKAGTRQEEGRYEDGQRVGRWSLWYPTGELREENDYVAGQMHGERRVFDKEGQLDRGRSGVFENGERVAPLPRE